ncbi:MAG: vanadium-dependent haloperoxidase [Deltaproteobacteria bacterium]|nr:vanadium-dependent haloperoxidase [Deltaproteobacteria bacterium]
MAFARPLPSHSTNGDEARYPNRIGNYSKGLPHNSLGEVDAAAYDALLAAAASGRPADFEAVPVAGTVKLANPQGGLAFDLEGPDSLACAQSPPPRFDSAEIAGEMVELYWMALTRDINFSDYATSADIASACDDLSHLSDFRGPTEAAEVTPATIFRGLTPGDLVGPLLSQFLLKDFSYGSLPVSQRQRTLVPGADYLTDFAAWLANQNGTPPATALQFDTTTRYIRNLRDLARYVQADAPYEAYLNACFILFALGVPAKAGNNPYKGSHSQAGFVSFGGPHILGLIAEVATRALKAVWYQKWFVHRRLRPEEYAGRVHVHASSQADYPIHDDVLKSSALSRVQSRYGTALLPMAYPEGCPAHPAYGAGHNAIAGAGVTMLKAWFQEDFVVPNPVVPTADGTALQSYSGSDAGQLTVGGELNKLAGNIAAGRNAGGVHWRSDYLESLILGETVAIGILEEQKLTFNEAHTFTFTKFDGTTITI